MGADYGHLEDGASSRTMTEQAAASGYLAHEFGDAVFVARDAARFERMRATA